jgi:hypothetical protein
MSGAIQGLIDVFLGGPSSWQERLEGAISFISPEGNEFTGKWRGSPRNMPKKLGILRHPKVAGDIVQDMDVGSALYSITFYFDGENNDTEARAFFQACKENGQWEVTHPVHGFLGLQLVSVAEIDNPVASGNITELNTEWIEPIDPLTLKTARELAGITDGKIDDLNINAAQQFADNILQATETLKGAIETTTNGISNLSDFVLGPLFTTVDALDNAVNGIQDGIQDTLNATVLQVNALAGQIQNLINLPLFANNKRDRLETYALLVAGLGDLLPGQSESTTTPTASNQVKRNATLTVELGMNAALASSAKIVTTTAVSPRDLGADDTGALETRAQAVQMAEDLTDIFNDIVEKLEAVQEDFSTLDIDDQYYSQSGAFADAALLFGISIEYLLSIGLNLAVERSFILDRPRTPIEITITEYGSLGENDALYDLFIRSNGLIGKEILLLPSGKEVIVYV